VLIVPLSLCADVAVSDLPSFLDKCAFARAEAQKKSEQPKTESTNATETKTVTAAEVSTSA
jgi:predicted RNA-binding Zn ribbon-like protein